MKTIGRTTEGRTLVECSEGEIRAFNILVQVTKGYSTYFGEGLNNNLDTELEGIFSAVSDWVQVADRANELRRLAGAIDNAIKRKLNDPT